MIDVNVSVINLSETHLYHNKTPTVMDQIWSAFLPKKWVVFFLGLLIFLQNRSINHSWPKIHFDKNTGLDRMTDSPKITGVERT